MLKVACITWATSEDVLLAVLQKKGMSTGMLSYLNTKTGDMWPLVTNVPPAVKGTYGKSSVFFSVYFSSLTLVTPNTCTQHLRAHSHHSIGPAGFCVAVANGTSVYYFDNWTNKMAVVNYVTYNVTVVNLPVCSSSSSHLSFHASLFFSFVLSTPSACLNLLNFPPRPRK